VLAAVFDFGDPARARRRAERIGGHLAWREHGGVLLTGDLTEGARITPIPGALRLERGHLGGRALYFGRTGSGVVAGTRVAAVAAACEARALDPDRLARCALASFDDAPSTVYRGITRLRAGERVEIGPDGERRSRPVPELTPFEGSPDDAARELWARLDAAVARAIEGHARVAVLVSGGLDSSCVLAAAVARARGASAREVDALTLDFASAGDDRPHMRALAAELGLVPLRVAPASCAPRVRPSLVLDAMPYTWPTGGWEIALLDATRARGAGLVLSGMGGDDVLDGDPEELADDAARGHVVRAIRAAARLQEPWESSPARRVYDYVLRPLARRAAPTAFRSAWRAWRSRRALPAWAGPRLRAAVSASDAPRMSGPTGRFARMSFNPGLLAMADMRAQLEAGASIRRVDPFLDPPIAELVARVSPELVFHGGRTRGLLRHAAAGRVPDGVRLRNDKAAFEPAFAEMLAAAGGLAALGDITEMRALADLGIVEPAPFRAALERFATNDDDLWLSIWPALACEAFVLAAERSRVSP
jgi:asparagine synthase (glutamine-hydrolysing)